MKMTTSNKLFMLPAKLKTTIYLLTATGLTFHAATNRSDSLPFSNTIRTAYEGVVRSSRAISTIAFTVADYKYSLHGLPTGSEDYLHELSEVHLRSASRILKLCETNKGFYIKAGQFVAAMRQVPEEYSSTLSSLQDQVIPCDFKEIKQVLTSNLGQDLFKIFNSLDEQPIAAASIAQVHHAILRDNHEVAIKVQYPGLEHKMRLDTTIMSFLSKSIAWFFPEYRFEWMVSEFARAIPLELDFIQEAKNSERTAENFRNNDVVRVPQVFWDFTTSEVLTMEFCQGCKVDDLKVLKEIKVNPIKVAKALVEVFAEMIFIHGFVHGDPHPGNMLVSPEGQNGFSLVLLDHGTYRTLDEAFRVNYCQLWKALILLDSNKIQHLGEQFGVGKYSIYFPLIFTGRTINSKSVLGTGISVEEKRQLKHDLNSLKFEDISSFMESLPPNFLAILRTDGLLRSIIRRLGAPQRIRLLAYAKYALYGLSPKFNPKSDFAVKAMYYRFKAMANYLQLKLVLETLELLSWIGKFKQFVLALLRKITGEAFLSAFLQVLFDRLASREFIDLLRGRRYDDLLEKLKITLLTVTALLNDAEEKQFYSPAVEKWLHMAKDALYDAEDVLDDLATEVLKSKLEASSQTNTTNQVNQWRLISSPLSSPFSRGIDFKLNKIIEKLEFIAKYKDILGLNDDVKGRLSLTQLKLPTTTSLVDESCIYGRDRDKKTILELLLMDEPSSNNKIGVIPIVGMGGVGKTMLAQLVYNDDQVQKHFDLRIWVCVSDQVDVLRVTTTILKSVTSKSAAHLDDLNLLQVSMRENLLGKKFLLVLDDVWSRRNNDWDLIWNPLRAGGGGSKIIVTTRDSNVAASMGTVPAHHLKCLSFEDCLAIFMNQAFENRNVYAFPSLEMIGTKIVNKCEGLPLAAKRLGILLRSRQEEEEWYDVLNRKIWALPYDESDIIQTLGLSYHHLPPHLKQCFAYCSIFPADYEFDKDSLVLLWMAEGFVQQPKGMKKLEEVGNEYFHELVSRSFFQPSVHNNLLYVMHGLMKDLADFVTGDFSFQLEDKVMDGGDQNTIFDKARHSSYLRSRLELLTKFEVFNGAEYLRTFLPLDPTGEIGASYLANEVPCEILPKLKNLRVLSFNACRITELPDSIGALKHLRYMDLSRTAIKRLPDSTGTLYNLQTLILLECYSLCELPMEIGKLTGLRHLRISETRLREMPLQMYRLKNLQTLSHFVVGKDSGSGIRDLRDMKDLQGTLLISGLQNVISFIDAVEANLKVKKGLARLVFQWNNSFDDSMNEKDEEEVYKVSKPERCQDLTNSTRFPSFREAMGANRQESVEFKLGQSGNLDDSRNEKVEMDVFEMLQPHENIKELLVKDYGGTRFPSWIGSPLFCNMLVLELSNCGKCQILPPLGQLPSLKDLTVEGMEGIKSVGEEFYGDMSSSSLPFPSLETLKFENMSQWEVWYEATVECCFLRLQNIEICNCPKLRRFSRRFPSLKRMSINGCQRPEALPRDLTLDSLEQGREFPCLRELSVSGCHNLIELPSVFPSLTTLEIDGCQELEVLPKLPSIVNLELNNCESKVLQSIVGSASLTYMRISKISNLECLVEGYLKRFTSLEELQISHLGELTTLSNEIGLQSLLSLKLLEISGCPFLKELPQNLYKLSSLKVLRIWNCPSLVSFPVTGLPSTLIGLEIKSCEALQLLPMWMMHDPHMKNERNTFSLEYLIIEGCPCLISLPREDEMSAIATLKGLEIQDCGKLQSIPETMICNNTCLEILKVSGCHCIESLPIISSSTVMKLTELVISNCKNLQPLPEGLHNLAFLVNLEIDGCPLLQSFPEPGLPASTLRSIRISNCQNLNRLPNRMYSLTCLQELSINGCTSIVSFPEGGLPANLMSLSILDCENLKPSSEWGFHRLTCLTEFTFGGCESLVSFPEGWLLPASVSSLHLERLPKLKYLPKGLKNLNCLETLEIWECDSLKSLPEKQPSTMLLSLWNAL